MENIKGILEQALSQIKPAKDKEEEVNKRIGAILEKINKSLKDAKAILGGSGEKGTWLKEAHDADIFVLFDYKKYKDKSDKLSDMLEKHLKKKFSKIIRLHGSRDYFQIKQKGFTFEIIPILAIKKAEQAKNITDISPLHSLWVKKQKKLTDDMRLAKQFCKAADVYGAESYIKGFSGYICEILTVYYSSFLGLIKNAAKWKDKVIIDPENYYKGRNILDEMNKSKTYSPIVIIDPVQAERNAAAALSIEKFESFKAASLQFLRNPSVRFFEKKEMPIEELKKKAKDNRLILLNVAPKTGNIDVVGSKLLKSFEFLNSKLKSNDFKVHDTGWSWDKKGPALFYFILDKSQLPEKKLHEGPPLKVKKHLETFKKKYKGAFVKDSRIYAYVKREFTKPEELIIELIKDPYIKEKTRKVSFVD